MPDSLNTLGWSGLEAVQRLWLEIPRACAARLKMPDLEDLIFRHSIGLNDALPASWSNLVLICVHKTPSRCPVPSICHQVLNTKEKLFQLKKCLNLGAFAENSWQSSTWPNIYCPSVQCTIVQCAKNLQGESLSMRAKNKCWLTCIFVTNVKTLAALEI